MAISVTKDDLFYFLGRKTAEVEQLTGLLEQAQEIIVEQKATIARLTPSVEEPSTEGTTTPEESTNG